MTNYFKKHSNFRETPLHFVARLGLHHELNLLMPSLTYFNEVDKFDFAEFEGQRTPLMWACTNGHCQIVKILLDNIETKNIEVNMHNKNCESAFFLATEKDFVEVSIIFIYKGK